MKLAKSNKEENNMHEDKNFANLLNSIQIIKIEMIGLKIERDKLLIKRNGFWEKVMKKKENQVNEISGVIEEIGDVTYKINKLISSLTQYHGNKDVMKLAIQYIDEEIERDTVIHTSKVKAQKLVAAGKDCYLFPDGTTSKDPNVGTNYIMHKERQIKMLKEKRNLLVKCMNSFNPTTIKKKIELIDTEFILDDSVNTMPRLLTEENE